MTTIVKDAISRTRLFTSTVIPPFNPFDGDLEKKKKKKKTSEPNLDQN